MRNLLLMMLALVAVLAMCQVYPSQAQATIVATATLPDGQVVTGTPLVTRVFHPRLWFSPVPTIMPHAIVLHQVCAVEVARCEPARCATCVTPCAAPPKAPTTTWKPDQAKAKPDQTKPAAKPDQAKIAKPDQAKPDQMKTKAAPDQVKEPAHHGVRGHRLLFRGHCGCG